MANVPPLNVRLLRPLIETAGLDDPATVARVKSSTIRLESDVPPRPGEICDVIVPEKMTVSPPVGAVLEL